MAQSGQSGSPTADSSVEKSVFAGCAARLWEKSATVVKRHQIICTQIWTMFRLRGTWKITLQNKASVTPDALLKVIDGLESDETSRFTWKLTQNVESYIAYNTVKYKLPAKTVGIKGKGVKKETGTSTLKPIKSPRKRKSPTNVAPDKVRLILLLEKKAVRKAPPAKSSTLNEGNSACSKGAELLYCFWFKGYIRQSFRW